MKKCQYWNLCIFFFLLSFCNGCLLLIVNSLNNLWFTRMLYAQDEEFVIVLEKGIAPHTRHVRGSNYCLLNVFEDRISGRAIIISVVSFLHADGTFKSQRTHQRCVLKKRKCFQCSFIIFVLYCGHHWLFISVFFHADIVYWYRSTILSRAHQAKQCRT